MPSAIPVVGRDGKTREMGYIVVDEPAGSVAQLGARSPRHLTRRARVRYRLPLSRPTAYRVPETGIGAKQLIERQALPLPGAAGPDRRRPAPPHPPPAGPQPGRRPRHRPPPPPRHRRRAGGGPDQEGIRPAPVLASDPPRVYTKEELLDTIWAYRGPSKTRTLDSHASRLRRKLDPQRGRFVVNCWGIGYRLIEG
jgi:hypothetical protein